MARTQSVVADQSSAASSGERSSNSPTSRYGITSTCPLVYGNRFKIANTSKPRHTTCVSESGSPVARMRANTEPGSSSVPTVSM